MPITPHYNLMQTPTHISIHVSIPHVRVSPKTLELVVDGSELHLYAPPTYLLKLVLPSDVVDEGLYEHSLEGVAADNTSVTGVCDESNCLVQEICGGEEAKSLVEEISESGAAQGTSDVSTPNEVNLKAAAPDTKLWTEEDLPKIQYDPLTNHGTIIITLRKVNDGIWEDLDLLGRLQKPLQNESKSLVTCVGDSDGDVVDAESNGIIGELKFIHQGSLRYGLFQTDYNVFADYARAGLADEMLECPNPDESRDNHDTFSRREMRLEMETSKFDSERYLGDAHLEEGDDMIYDTAIQMIPHWMDTTSTPDGESSVFFTQDESHQLATLKKCEIPVLSKDQIRSILLALSDMLFAYAYDHRTTDGESTIESSWTVMILSPTFSWLEGYNAPYDSIEDVIRWCLRRSLIYPYLRNYNLAAQVARDVATILSRGRRVVLRCLLQMHSIMEKSESHYLFNKLYVDPMIWWVQSCREETFREFGHEMKRALCIENADRSDLEINQTNLLSKQYLGLGLVELEHELEQTQSESSSDASDSTNDSNKPEEEKVAQLIQTLDINTNYAETDEG